MPHRAFKTFQDECGESVNTSATLNVKKTNTTSSCNDQRADPGPDLTYCEQGTMVVCIATTTTTTTTTT